MAQLMKMQDLICQHDGHIWQRPSQRGRKPLLCPEHSEQPVRAIPAGNDEGAWDALIERARIALDSTYDPEAIRKINYILSQLTSGLREPADEKHLAETLTHLIRTDDPFVKDPEFKETFHVTGRASGKTAETQRIEAEAKSVRLAKDNTGSTNPYGDGYDG
jgi:hypothetical protein